MFRKTPLFLLTIGSLFGATHPQPCLGQAFNVLHDFRLAEGSSPQAEIILNSHTLYGELPGTPLAGPVFAVGTDGTGFRNLDGFGTGQNGAGVSGGLIVSGNVLYGTAQYGGKIPGYSSSYSGTIFALTTDGGSLTTLHVFATPLDNDDGANPVAGLLLSDNTLYGTASSGGPSGSGTVFKINTDGTDFAMLYGFSTDVGTYPGPFTNSDGASPQSNLTISGSQLFGTTHGGGTWGLGVVFSLNNDGSGFKTLHSFTGGEDGAVPVGRIGLSGKTVFGVTQFGGSSSNGTIFKLDTDGNNFSTLHSFGAYTERYGPNNDGYWPEAGVTVSGNCLYGVTSMGGNFAGGTVFTINLDGTEFQTLHQFETGWAGGTPLGELALSRATLYGTTSKGGMWGGGIVFSLSVQPQLHLSVSPGTCILRWPTNFEGYSLQSTSNLTSGVWTTNLTAVTMDGNYTFTNPISSPQQFFRLSR